MRRPWGRKACGVASGQRWLASAACAVFCTERTCVSLLHVGLHGVQGPHGARSGCAGGAPVEGAAAVVGPCSSTAAAATWCCGVCLCCFVCTCIAQKMSLLLVLILAHGARSPRPGRSLAVGRPERTRRVVAGELGAQSIVGTRELEARSIANNRMRRIDGSHEQSIT